SWRPHRSAARSVRRAGWQFTVDRDFAGVMRACAEPSAERPSTWITPDFERSYSELHRRGLAHSVEVWAGDDLVGGLYGVTLGGFFGGESMFHRGTDASKAALGLLSERLRPGGFSRADAQAPTPHLAHLGAVTIPRADYLARLRRALAATAQLTSSCRARRTAEPARRRRGCGRRASPRRAPRRRARRNRPWSRSRDQARTT